jgi:archaellum component FlaG (FlaF/FlaG flagellin family)
METAIVSLVCVAVLLIGTVTTVFTSFKAATKVSDSLKEMETHAAEMRRTDIDANISSYSNPLQMLVDNSGQSNLNDFSNWDVIAE